MVSGSASLAPNLVQQNGLAYPTQARQHKTLLSPLLPYSSHENIGPFQDFRAAHEFWRRRPRSRRKRIRNEIHRIVPTIMPRLDYSKIYIYLLEYS
ncbi:hypothetical protein A4H96_05975 [Acidithiobacillus ferrooxidans]|uniref:Uncharacterized protein n=1 Tax=Acidithiobacillus ferrooxidans TaxID=920 RepID=A0A179BL64_ACIFR|nr:hypothetical protein A4H96_05975 [Acidithiobacillus ferrooxidans]